MKPIVEPDVEYRIEGGDVWEVTGETEDGEFLVLGEKIE